MTPFSLLVDWLKLLTHLKSKQSGENVNEYKDEYYQNSFADIFRIVGPSKLS